MRTSARHRLTAAAGQFVYLAADFRRIVNRRWWRIASAPFSAGFAAVASYRFERCMYLLLGRSWKVARVLLSPVAFLLRPWLGNSEIHYEADIAGGLKILHPSLGVVVSKRAVIGENCTLTGGNLIGGRRPNIPRGGIRLGRNVTMGAKAVALGPIRIGDRVVIGAGAVAISDIEPFQVVVGVPARPVDRSMQTVSVAAGV